MVGELTDLKNIENGINTYGVLLIKFNYMHIDGILGC